MVARVYLHEFLQKKKSEYYLQAKESKATPLNEREQLYKVIINTQGLLFLVETLEILSAPIH